ncbi:hypothetical protein M408DRAFT_333099 [Serendipita vermifera MAFF 305830]|uniref:Uncharacterized protein n=1 Tax=Serendipita vermifera MAFF 305830 TaxID=933852 RepID=A0A0C2WXG4_SERVB|nr:hypothetical protein M408DRAFT_333099 [Serendipita vermifera MAFF 305830]
MSPKTPSRLPQVSQRQQAAASLFQQQHIWDKRKELTSSLSDTNDEWCLATIPSAKSHSTSISVCLSHIS